MTEQRIPGIVIWLTTALWSNRRQQQGHRRTTKNINERGSLFSQRKTKFNCVIKGTTDAVIKVYVSPPRVVAVVSRACQLRSRVMRLLAWSVLGPAVTLLGNKWGERLDIRYRKQIANNVTPRHFGCLSFWYATIVFISFLKILCLL